jgi:hypothetical protein
MSSLFQRNIAKPKCFASKKISLSIHATEKLRVIGYELERTARFFTVLKPGLSLPMGIDWDEIAVKESLVGIYTLPPISLILRSARPTVSF